MATVKFNSTTTDLWSSRTMEPYHCKFGLHFIEEDVMVQKTNVLKRTQEETVELKQGRRQASHCWRATVKTEGDSNGAAGPEANPFTPEKNRIRDTTVGGLALSHRRAGGYKQVSWWAGIPASGSDHQRWQCGWGHRQHTDTHIHQQWRKYILLIYRLLLLCLIIVFYYQYFVNFPYMIKFSPT